MNIETFTNNNFKLNGFPYAKVYQLRPTGFDGKFKLVNINDIEDTLFSDVSLDKISVDGVVYTDVEDLFDNLVGVTFNLAGGSSASSTTMFYDSVRSQDFSRVGQTTEAVMNQQANIFEEYLDLLTTPTESGKYMLYISVVWSHNANGDNFMLELVTSGGSIGDTFRFTDLESKDIAGAGIAANTIVGGVITGISPVGTDIEDSSVYIGEFDLVAGVTYHFSLQWASQTANDEATIHRALIALDQKTKI